MIKSGKLVIFLFIFLFLVQFTSAEIQTLGTFKQGNCITLIQTCGNCTYSNITQVVYPNNTQALGQVEMTKIDSQYNYSNFCSTDISGQYIVNGVSDVDGYNTAWAYDFFITPSGAGFDSSKATTYFLIFIFSILVFAGLLFLGLKLPGDNKRDEMTGYIIALSNIKYLKIVFLGLAYLVALFISYFAWNISYNYLDMAFMTTIFRFISTTLTILVLPMFILLAWISIANLVRDNKIGDMITKGVRMR